MMSVRVAILMVRVGLPVAMTVMVCVRLCVVVSWAGVAVGGSEEMDRNPSDMEHQ